MSRYGRVRLLLATAIVVLTGSVWVAARLQAKADTDSSRALEAGQKMLIAMLDQETGLRGYLLTRDRGFLAPYRAGQAAFERSLAIARHDARDGNDQALIARQVAAARTWQALAKGALARPEAARSVTAARSRKAEMDRFRAPIGASSATSNRTTSGSNPEQTAARWRSSLRSACSSPCSPGCSENGRRAALRSASGRWPSSAMRSRRLGPSARASTCCGATSSAGSRAHGQLS